MSGFFKPQFTPGRGYCDLLDRLFSQMTKVRIPYQYRLFPKYMQRFIMLTIVIGIVVFTTIVELMGGSIAHSYLYNNIWLASDNDTPECLTSYDNGFTCPHTDPEYYHGFYWSNKIMTISILVAGTVFGVKLYRKKTEKITKKPLVIMACVIVLIVIMVFAMGHFRTQSYYEGAYDFVMFDCFEERANAPTLHVKIVYQNATHVIDNKNCQWEIRQ